MSSISRVKPDISKIILDPTKCYNTTKVHCSDNLTFVCHSTKSPMLRYASSFVPFLPDLFLVLWQYQLFETSSSRVLPATAVLITQSILWTMYQNATISWYYILIIPLQIDILRMNTQEPHHSDHYTTSTVLRKVF